jgi:hypothetical protein
MDKNTALELAAVAVVGFGFAKVTEAIPALNDRRILTRTLLYTLGFAVAAYARPAGGYKLLGDSK